MRIREMFVAFIRDTNSVAHAYHEIGPINCKKMCAIAGLN